MRMPRFRVAETPEFSLSIKTMRASAFESISHTGQLTSLEPSFKSNISRFSYVCRRMLSTQRTMLFCAL